MDYKSREWLKGKFREYYSSHILTASYLEAREWGFGNEKKIDQRHYAFANANELNGFLRREAPLFVSHSIAHYEFPDARPMEKKNWKKADLVFDFDADEILSCPYHEKGWVCSYCLGRTKEEAQKLIHGVLIGDFGISEEKIRLNFSGNRGYHVHIVDEKYMALGSEERREIINYITGRGLDFSFIFYEEPMAERRIKAIRGPSPGMGGWKGKFASMFLRMLEKETLHELGVHESIAKKFYKNKKQIMNEIERGNWDVIPIVRKEAFWKLIFQKIAVNLGEKIDEGVTLDTSKLIRMPLSLHGETGLLAQQIKLDEFRDYNPMESAVIFNEKEVEIEVEKAPKITLKGKEFGPYENEKIKVPEYFAVYVIGKGRAKII